MVYAKILSRTQAAIFKSWKFVKFMEKKTPTFQKIIKFVVSLSLSVLLYGFFGASFHWLRPASLGVI